MIRILQKLKCNQFVGCLFLMALLSLTVQVTPILWPQQLVWLEYLVVGGCLMLAISFLFLRTNCQLSVTDILVTIWCGYVFLRAYFQLGYPCSYEVTVSFVLYGLYILLRILFSVASLRDDLLEHLIILAAFIEVGVGIWQLCVGRSLHPLFPVTGSFYNPGPYAAYVAIGMSVALTQLAELKRDVKGYGYRKSTYFLLYAKFGSAMGRLVIWFLSVRLLVENGFLGAGIGSFKGEYGRALSCFFSRLSHADCFSQYADVTDYAFCDLLQVGVEQGWIGVLLCLLLAALAIHTMRKNARLASRDATMFVHAANINDCYSLLDYCCEDKAFLFGFAKMLQADERYVDSNSMLMRGTKVSNDPMFWVLMGNNLKAMRLYVEAVACYDKASGMLPNRLYPIYQKMKLYGEVGMVLHAKSCARLLLARKPKVHSSATKQMFDEACDVLKQ